MFWNSGQVDAGVSDGERVPRLPIGLGSLGLTTKDVSGTLCRGKLIARGHDRERSGGTLKIFECNTLLAYKFLTDQFFGDCKTGLGLSRE
jgi:hypothetical protein